MRGSDSRGGRFSRTAVAAALLIATGAIAPGQVGTRLEKVRVAFDVKDWRYQSVPGVEDVGKSAAEALATALQKRIGHLEFQTRAENVWMLACSLDSAERERDARDPGHKNARAASRLYFTLTSPTGNVRPIDWDIPYRTSEA